MKRTLLPNFIFLILSCGACVKLSDTNQSKPIVQSSPIAQVSPTPQNLKVEPLINFFSLANKSALEVEKIYRKPSLIDTKIVQFKNGEYRIYNKFGERFLQIDYFAGKAVAFYLDIPEASQTKSPEETLKLCGFDLRLADAQTELKGYWWDSPQDANPFYIVRISRFNDSRLYYNCEAHIKIN